MADLTDLGVALRASAGAADPPPFEALVGRARTRRRRRALAGTLVTVLLVVLAGGVATVLAPGGGDGSSPQPVQRPSATPSTTRATHDIDALSAAQVVARGHLVALTGNVKQELGVFATCTSGGTRCRYAWRLVQDGGVIADGLLPRGSLGAAVGSGPTAFAIVRRDDPGVLVDPRGRSHPLSPTGAVHAGADSILVDAAAGPVLVDPRTRTVAAVPVPPGSEAAGEAAVGLPGTVWTLPAASGPGLVRVAALRDGGWRFHTVDDPTSDVEVPGLLAVAGPRVAALTSYDGVTAVRAGALAVSTDDGATWTALSGADLPFGTVDSMAATTGGRLYVAEPDGTLWRSRDRDWTAFRRVTTARGVGVVAADDSVLVQDGARVVRVRDDGVVRTERIR